jgi:hypothetical protein
MQDWTPEPELNQPIPRRVKANWSFSPMPLFLLVFVVPWALYLRLGITRAADDVWHRYSLIVWTALGLLALIGIFVSYVKTKLMHKGLARRGSATAGEIISKERVDRDELDTFKYTISYRSSATTAASLKVQINHPTFNLGDRVTVLYDPVLPGRAVIYVLSRYKAVLLATGSILTGHER